MKRVTSVAFTIAVAASLLATAPNSASASTDAPVATKFVMKSFGFASRASGGTAPVSSDRTAYNIIGCTTIAGRQMVNTEVGVAPPPVTSLKGAATTLWTVKHAGKVSSWARDSITEARLSGGLTLQGISGTSHAYYDSGFKQHTTSALSSVSLAGSPLTVPTPGNPTALPDGGMISVADSSTSSANSHGAVSDIVAVRVVMPGTHTVVLLGRAHSTIAGGAIVGVFGGQAYGSQATADQPATYSGPTPLLVMACQGTHGALVTRNAATTTLPHTGLVTGAGTAERGQQVGSKADMWTRAKVTNFALSGGTDLTVDNVTAQAHVWFVRGITPTVQRSSAGTTPGSIFLNGQRQTVPRSGTLELPGVATIETNLVTMTAYGVRVLAVRITMHDGSSTVINLGYASASINPSP